ncbi:unnamed protein product, partial [Eretmochelys imbricata]
RQWEEHLGQAAAVLRSLRKVVLTANPKECCIGWQETTYLRYTIGGGWVKPLTGKGQALAECLPLTKKHQVLQFLGLTGYYRRFIPQFTSIASPLMGLLTKDSPKCMLWTQECEDTFRTLEERHCWEPVLYSPDFDCDFILHTDALE